MGLLSYLDFVYEGGKLAGSTTPTYVKTDGTLSDLDGGTAGTQAGAVLVGTSRIEFKIILCLVRKVFRSNRPILILYCMQVYSLEYT
jgi:hypothetical protein